VAYGPGQAYPPYPGVNPAWLAANADRERTVGVLRAGFTEGRLGQDELGDRIARAYAARTYSDLWTLTADLPQGPLPYPGGLAAVPYQPGNLAVTADAEPATNWHSAAALVITALVIFTLAALVTAIATAHAGGPVGYQPGLVQQQWAPPPPVQNAQLLPYQQHEPFQHLRIGPSVSAPKAGA
jgi:Domain of unknown function (DUF1707)